MFQRSTIVNETSIECTSRVELRKAVYGVLQYPALRGFFERIVAAHAEPIRFATEGGGVGIGDRVGAGMLSAGITLGPVLPPPQQQDITDRPLSRRIGGGIDDLAVNDHRCRSAAVEVECRLTAPVTEEVGERC